MNLHKIFKALTIHTTPPPSTSPNHTAAAKNVPVASIPQQDTQFPPDMDDLVAQHLAQRAARMFAAEEAEARRVVESRLREGRPTPAPMSVDPPVIVYQRRERATRHRSRQRSGEVNELRTSRVHHRTTRRHRDPLERLRRTDRTVRASALATITATMLDTSLDGRAAAITLRKTMKECRSAGVPFGELLEEEMENFGMVPLVFQIIRCNWNNDAGGRDLLLFLLEHSLSRRLMWNIRRGCMIRGDDMLFQVLRQLATTEKIHPWEPPSFEYNASVQTDNQATPSSALLGPLAERTTEFRVLISIPHFPTVLERDAQSLQKRREIPPEKRGGDGQDVSKADPGLLVEWIACDRAWSLHIGDNHLTLCLQDGESTSVNASLVVIKDESGRSSRTLSSNLDLWTPIENHETNWSDLPKLPPQEAQSRSPEAEIGIGVPGPSSYRKTSPKPPPKPILLEEDRSPRPRPPRSPRPPRILTFPPNTALHPVASNGSHRVTLSPCFPPSSHSLFTTSVSEANELLVELIVCLDKLRPDIAVGSKNTHQSGGRRFFSPDDESYAADQAGEEDWETQSLGDLLPHGDEGAGPSGSRRSTEGLANPRRATYPL